MAPRLCNLKAITPRSALHDIAITLRDDFRHLESYDSQQQKTSIELLFSFAICLEGSNLLVSVSSVTHRFDKHLTALRPD